MHTTNYRDTFITVSPDTRAEVGTVPTKQGSIAQLQYALVSGNPYALASDDLLFEVHALRNEIADADRDAARISFFSRGQACLRASPLVKQFGWGVHHDSKGRIALFGMESEDYRALNERADVKSVPGIRSKRA